MLKHSSRAVIALAALGLLTCGSGVQCQVISVQFQDGAGTPIPSTDYAGVVSADNFNVLTSSSYTGTVLHDENNVAAATLSGSALGGYRAGSAFPSGSGDADLLSAELYDSYDYPGTAETGDTNSINVTGILYATYDVYVYGGSDAAGRIGTFGLTSGGSTSYFSLTAENQEDTYTQATSTYNGQGAPPSGIPTANYVEFTGLSGGSFTLTFGAENSDGSLAHGAENGFQIVEVVPEPSTWVMLSAGLGLLVWQIRSRRSFAA
jgi:hypothetical protein